MEHLDIVASKCYRCVEVALTVESSPANLMESVGELANRAKEQKLATHASYTSNNREQ